MTFVLETSIFAKTLSLSFQRQHDPQIIVWDILLDIPFLETVLELYFPAWSQYRSGLQVYRTRGSSLRDNEMVLLRHDSNNLFARYIIFQEEIHQLLSPDLPFSVRYSPSSLGH